MIANFVNESEIVGMAGMHYLADYEKYDVSESEIAEIKKKNEEQQRRAQEADRLWEETESL